MMFPGGARLCRISNMAIYRALGVENIRHRRKARNSVLMRRLLSLDFVLEHPGLNWLPTLTGSTITSCITGGGSVFVTRALTSRCLREYCSGYFRSSSQADAVHVGDRVISTTSWNVFWSSPSPIVRTVFRCLNGRLVGRLLDPLEVMGAKISLGSF